MRCVQSRGLSEPRGERGPRANLGWRENQPVQLRAGLLCPIRVWRPLTPEQSHPGTQSRVIPGELWPQATAMWRFLSGHRVPGGQGLTASLSSALSIPAVFPCPPKWPLHCGRLSQEAAEAARPGRAVTAFSKGHCSSL